MPGTVGTEDRRIEGQDRILTNRMVTIISGHGGDVLQADTVNLGPGGMFVATDKDFDIGDRFICRIDLGEPYKPILSGAEVRWLNHTTDHRGMGVRFLDIAEAASSLSGELPLQGPETVKVRLDSVGPALDGEVVERQDRALVVDVELPFLCSGAQVEVGPNIAARSAAISEVEWVPAKDGGTAKMRLRLDMERTDVEVATDRVVQDRRESLGEESEKLEVVRLYSREPRAARPQEPAAPEPALKKLRKPKKNKKVSNWVRRAQLLSWTDQGQASAESRPSRRREAELLVDPPREGDLEGSEVVTIDGEVEEERLVIEAASSRDDESRVARSPLEADEEAEEARAQEAAAEPRGAASEALAAEQEEARGEAKRGETTKRSVTKTEAKTDASSEEAARDEEEIDSSEFSPLRGALERVLGAAIATRIMAFLATVKPRAILAAQWSKAKAIKGWGWTKAKTIKGWSWTKAKAGPALVRGLKAVRKKIARPRRQDRGEPSKIVRNLTDRARKAAAGRGKTVAVVLLVVIGLAGLGTAGYGLLGNSSTEEQRQELQSEAQRSGWTSERWQEPEPAPNS